MQNYGHFISDSHTCSFEIRQAVERHLSNFRTIGFHKVLISPSRPFEICRFYPASYVTLNWPPFPCQTLLSVLNCDIIVTFCWWGRNWARSMAAAICMKRSFCSMRRNHFHYICYLSVKSSGEKMHIYRYISSTYVLFMVMQLIGRYNASQITFVLPCGLLGVIKRAAP